MFLLCIKEFLYDILQERKFFVVYELKKYMERIPIPTSEVIPESRKQEELKKSVDTEAMLKLENELVELPQELGGGYVKRSALEAYEGWEQLAKEANEGRSVFKKIFLVDKKSAMDFARVEADKEENERTKENERKLKLNAEKETLIRVLSESFDNIFFDAGDSPYLEGFQKLVFEGHIDTIFSEDKSGRIPALICKKFLNAVYEEEGKNRVRGFSMPIGRVESYKYTKRCQEDIDFVASKLSELADKNILGTNILYVTDFVAGGGTAKRFLDAVRQVSFREEKNVWASYLLVTLGSRQSYGGGFYGSGPIPMKFKLMRNGGLDDGSGYDTLYENFSGVSRSNNTVSHNHLSKETMEARREVINEVTHHLFERWREWKTFTTNEIMDGGGKK